MPEPMERPNFLGRDAPASIRYNNPGAQYPGVSARRHNSIGTKVIGGGHKIAVFDDAIDGAAALFDLMDRVYTGMSVRDAIAKWSGGNYVGTYLAILKRKGDIDPDTVISKAKLRDPEWAIRFAKAMAWHEAGTDYPLSDEDWRLAHVQAFVDVVEPTPIPRPVAKKVVKDNSAKWSVSSFFKWILAFFGGGTASWPAIKSSMDGMGDFSTTMVQMVSGYGLHVVAAILIIGAIGFNWLQMRQVDDYQEGRYTPSGASE